MVYESEARRPIVLIRMNKRAIKPARCITRCGNQASTVGSREVRNRILMIQQRRKQLITHSIRYGKVLPGSPGVLAIEAVAELVIVHYGRRCELGGIHVAKQEIGYP